MPVLVLVPSSVISDGVGWEKDKTMSVEGVVCQLLSLFGRFEGLLPATSGAPSNS